MSAAFTPADKLRCAERELSKRRQVFPRLVEAGRMTQAQMDREIAVMAAIADDYRAQAAAAAPDLFATAGAHDA